jgi:ribosome-associated protein
MQDDDDIEEIRPPSKSMRKRDASAAQDLGERLIALTASELATLDLPEKLMDAIELAQRITARGGLARQRQYIGKLMRDIDPAPIEATLAARAKGQQVDAEKHKRIEAWRTRLLSEGPKALEDLLKWRPDADKRALQALITKATGARVDPGSRDGAARELFRALRGLFDGPA